MCAHHTGATAPRTAALLTIAALVLGGTAAPRLSPRPTEMASTWCRSRSPSPLRALARDAGGRILQPANAQALPAIYLAIAEELANQYDLAYVPRDGGRVGACRHLAVRIRPPASGVARTRSDYDVTRPAATTGTE